VSLEIKIIVKTYSKAGSLNYIVITHNCKRSRTLTRQLGSESRQNTFKHVTYTHLNRCI